MATKTEAALGLEFGAPFGEGNWNVWADTNWVKLGATAQISVENKILTAPPVTLVDGNRYIIAAGATGAWSGKDGQLAFAVDGSYQYYTLKSGWLVHDRSDNTVKVWNGTAFVEPSAAAIAAAVAAEAVIRAAADTALDGRVDTLEATAISLDSRLDTLEGESNQAGVQFKDEGSNLGTSGTVTTVDFTGAGVTASRDGTVLTVDVAGGGGSGVVETIVAGTNITVDDTDPANPIISASGGGGGVTSGDITISVPTDYATYALALAAAKGMACTGRLQIVLEAGYTLADPLWHDGVYIPNLDIICTDTPQAVDASAFVAVFAGAYKTVFGGKNSTIGRLLGTLDVTAGDSAALFALIGENFHWNAGSNNYIGTVVNCGVTGTSQPAIMVGGSIGGGATFAIDAPQPSRYAATSFNGPKLSAADSIGFGSFDPGTGAQAIPCSGSLSGITITGAADALVSVWGCSLSLGRIVPGTGSFYVWALLRGEVNCDFGDVTLAQSVALLKANTSSKIVAQVGVANWTPGSTLAELAQASIGSSIKVAFGDIIIDSSTAIPDYLVTAEDSSEVTLHSFGTPAVTGSFGAVANITKNVVNVADGSLVRTNC